MDPLTHAYLATQHIQDLLHDAETQRARRQPASGAPDPPTVYRRRAAQACAHARRQLGLLLIRAGRRLAGGDAVPAYHSFGGVRR